MTSDCVCGGGDSVGDVGDGGDAGGGVVLVILPLVPCFAKPEIKNQDGEPNFCPRPLDRCLYC